MLIILALFLIFYAFVSPKDISLSVLWQQDLRTLTNFAILCPTVAAITLTFGILFLLDDFGLLLQINRMPSKHRR